MRELLRTRDTRGGRRRRTEDGLVARDEIGANEPILVPEQRVERCLGDTSSLDDAVDTNGMNAVLIEELMGGVKQSGTR